MNLTDENDNFYSSFVSFGELSKDDFDSKEKPFYTNFVNSFSYKNINENKFCELPTKVTSNDLINNCNQERLSIGKNININDNEKNITKENNTQLTQKKRGRAKKTGSHNKFSDDNVRRKCKHIILKSTLEFINEMIRIKYDNNIGNGILKKQLLTINQKQKADATVQFNKDFLNKTLKDIFSENISSRFTIYQFNHNEKLINELMNNEDEEKRQYFNNLFNLTFTQCLRHFRKTEYIEELQGLKGIDYVKKKYENEPDYLDTLNFYIFNYEEITINKRHRNRKKKEIKI
jgi:hypothetical protein